MGVVTRHTRTMKQVTVLVVGLLTARHCSTSPLLPVVSLLQDMPMEGMEMMPMMTSEPMMTAMAAATPTLMMLSTFLPGLGIGVLKGMLFSVLLDRQEKKSTYPPGYQHSYPSYPLPRHHSFTGTTTNYL